MPSPLPLLLYQTQGSITIMNKEIIHRYYREIDKKILYSGTKNENTLRDSFSNLINSYCEPKHLQIISNLHYKTSNKYPDGTIRDVLRLDHGYWESKTEGNLIKEIQEKFDKGYPKYNILFEDSKTAILYQNGKKVKQIDIKNADELHSIITDLVTYERPVIQEFKYAIDNFKKDLPNILTVLRETIEYQYEANQDYKKGFDCFLDLCKKSINPKTSKCDVQEMIIQHILTQDLFNSVFGETQIHEENTIAKELNHIVNTFFHHDVKRNTMDRIKHYYETIKAYAAQINNHHEKQSFLKVLYENFYIAYDRSKADRLGVVYTPREIVQFMIKGTEHLLIKYFGKVLSDKNVMILDPATGTGTFITEIIDHIERDKLEYKYRNELFCNEIEILPYYIANLNIEYTYRQKMESFLSFENICFVDSLEYMGTNKQMPLFSSLTEENLGRINRQNSNKISVIIGNPPYNANQSNANDNNKNRKYPIIDQTIRNTYVKNSMAQKNKLYDPYVRFYRWATDRLDHDGIIAFITNNSFIHKSSFDGFRKCLTQDFSEIYIIDLGGDIKTLSGLDGIFLNENHTIFGKACAVGIAITFLIKRTNHTGHGKIHYIHPCDIRSTREEKFHYLIHTDFSKISFISILQNSRSDWIQSFNPEYKNYLSLGNKGTKVRGNSDAIFEKYSTGLVTNRDDWMIDKDKTFLENKVKFFISVYKNSIKINKQINTIKWSEKLKTKLFNKELEQYNQNSICEIMYRPFIKRFVYNSDFYLERRGLIDNIFPYKNCNNICICAPGIGNRRPFGILITNIIPTLDLAFEKVQYFPLYYYDNDGIKQENISEFGLNQFVDHYKDDSITKTDIFYYCCATLHNKSYCNKYKIELARELPRMPFYKHFKEYIEYGRVLSDLQINYENISPYPIKISKNKTNKKLKINKVERCIYIDTDTTIIDIPKDVFNYQLGNRSAIECVIDQYQEKKSRYPLINQQFNTYEFKNHKDECINLLSKVIQVSLEMVKIIDAITNLD